MTDKPSLADLERAVEESWEKIYNAEATFGTSAVGLQPAAFRATKAWLLARRAARDAGMVSVLVSREAVEALRLYAETNGLTAVSLPLRLLARDLAAVLKADGE